MSPRCPTPASAITIPSTPVLTLLLLVGAVICSPVPSDNPTLAAHDAAHVEVTHEVHHVTFEVSEEVSEATASSQAPSGEPPEDDPPIPTATTPPTTPEDQQPKNHFQGVDNAEFPENSELLESQTNVESHKNLSEYQTEENVFKEDGASISQKKAEEDTLEVIKDVANGGHKVLSGEGTGVMYGGNKENVGSEENEEHTGLSDVEAGVNVNGGDTVHEAMLKEVYHDPDRIVDHTGEGLVRLTASDVEGMGQVERESEEVMGSSSPIEIVERSDAGGITLHSEAPEVEAQASSGETGIMVPGESVAETVRKSRVYIGVPEDSSEGTQAEEPTLLEKVEGYINSGLDLADTGLEIMSLTSPTPEAPSESVPTEDLESQEEEVEEVPPADVETEATIVFVDPDSEENSTIVAGSENPEEELESESNTKPEVESEVQPDVESEVQPDVESEVQPDIETEAQPDVESVESEVQLETESVEVHEATPEATSDTAAEVVPEVVPEVAPEVPETISQPSPTTAPLPGEEYTDAYNDPIDSGGLPDVDVTKEELPSKEYPQPEMPAEEPSHPQDQSEKVDGGDSSDLAASDHMMEVEAGTAWVLPPQQEQVSAVAPEAMTPGCIVGIVFGVLLSLIVLLGVGGFVIWQRRTLNRPKVLGSDRGYAGSDSGGYIDDQGQVPEASQSAQAQQIPQVLIHLKNLKPSLPQGMGDRLKKSLPTMPKIAPVNLPSVGQVISKRQSGGSNQPGQ
ncbi:uncharacterized protein [Panulirus ornatus]|uniref:uncharacterized protein isoform X3 n=1 Tax=Panulirus ornatus TaxID=150431 RepID=UPI003A8A5BC5